MKIEFTVDGRPLHLNVNSDKPLNLILREDLGNYTVSCSSIESGLSLVLIDDIPEISAMVPAFQLQGRKVVTFRSFKRSKKMSDIEKAYEKIGVYPCPDCEAARALLFDFLATENSFSTEMIKRDLSMIDCHCISLADQMSILSEIIEIRRIKERVKYY